MMDKAADHTGGSGEAEGPSCSTTAPGLKSRRTPPLGFLISSGLGLTATSLWLWMAWCTFPVHSWNAIRIAPAFMLTAGVNPYPGLHEGPVTTWIYGPLPILWMWPATWANDAASALLIAASLNLAVAFIPLVFVSLSVATFIGDRDPMRAVWTVLLGLCVWPATNLHFWQADNVAVACGLASIFIFATTAPGQTVRLWLAAGMAAAALWSKQTELAPILAQLAFALWRHGSGFMFRQSARIIAAVAGLAVLSIGSFGMEGLWLNMFGIPGGIPREDLIGKLLHPTYIPYAALHVLLPVALVLWHRRRVFTVTSPWCLPALSFAFSLPINLLGFSTIGGNINSLHGHLYLVPMAAWVLAGRARSRPFAMLAVVLTGLAMQTLLTKPVAIHPLTLALKQGRALAEQLPGEVYFPWNPLITYYSEGRFYHAEDGLLTRQLTGHTLSDEELFRHLPERLAFVAYQGSANEGILMKRVSSGSEPIRFGIWVLIPFERPSLLGDATSP